MDDGLWAIKTRACGGNYTKRGSKRRYVNRNVCQSRLAGTYTKLDIERR